VHQLARRGAHSRHHLGLGARHDRSGSRKLRGHSRRFVPGARRAYGPPASVPRATPERELPVRAL